MAHYAQLDENSIVLQVIVLNNSEVTNYGGDESEEVGVEFCKSLLGVNTLWKQTSYNNTFRGKYAEIGDFYDESLDLFYSLTAEIPDAQ